MSLGVQPLNCVCRFQPSSANELRRVKSTSHSSRKSLAGFRGRYITLGTIHTIHADDIGHPAPPSRNVGMYRVQLFGPRTMAMHWHMHHDGARHWRSWKAKGERMPVAIALGGESVLPYAATAPMPPGISELLLAGFLNRGPIPLVHCWRWLPKESARRFHCATAPRSVPARMLALDSSPAEGAPGALAASVA